MLEVKRKRVLSSQEGAQEEYLTLREDIYYLKTRNATLNSAMRRQEEALVQSKGEIKQLKLLVRKIYGNKYRKSISSSNSEPTKHRFRTKALSISDESEHSDRNDPTSRNKCKDPK